MRRFWVTIVAPIALACTACGSSPNDLASSSFAATTASPPATEEPVLPEEREFKVSLRPVEVIGGSVERFEGEGAFDLDRATGMLEGSIQLGWLETQRVTLNRGVAGEVGPELTQLEGDSWVNEWVFPPSFQLTADDMDLLDAGGLYLQATTDSSPQGGVRGQLLPASGAAWVEFFNAFGMQVVPFAGGSGSAMVAITVARESRGAAADNVVIHVNAVGEHDIHAAHLHAGMAGESGPMLASLTPDPEDTRHWILDGSTLGDDLMATLVDHLADHNRHYLYVDLHTADLPQGVLRGQLAMATEHYASLRGDDVVPRVETTGFGAVAVTVTDYVGWDWVPQATLHVNLYGMGDATAVTVNRGAPLQNGPVVHGLTRDPNDPGHWFGTELLLDDTQADFEGFYVTVATPAFPDGELRAQLSARNALPQESEQFVVRTVLPADGAMLDAFPDAIDLQFSETVDADSAVPGVVRLEASGGDASFDEQNQQAFLPLTVSAAARTMSIHLAGSSAADDVYRLTLDGSGAAPITADGSPLVGYPGAKVEAGAGTDFITTFVVDSTRPLPANLQRIQDTVFTPSCALSGCHAGGRPAVGLDLSPGLSWDSLHAPDRVISLVEANAPDDSALVRKLTDPWWWHAHPQGHLTAGNAEVQLLRRWIDGGAQNN